MSNVTASGEEPSDALEGQQMRRHRETPAARGPPPSELRAYGQRSRGRAGLHFS